MASLNTQDREFLTTLFGDRVTFDRIERKLYSHDVAAIPGLVKPLVGHATCEGVVQPRTEEQVVDLLTWAARRGVALTPRGKATSGYGGVIPVKKGVVVDFYFMKDVLEVDHDAQTARVQPGVTW